MKIALRFVEGALTGQIKEAFLYDKKHVLVGRDSQANIVLPESDRSASTTHAKIVFEKGEIFINDVGSHYGTFVNHKPATRSKIKHGDFIRFGVKGPLAEFIVVPEGQTMATPVVKPAVPLERNAQSPTGAPIHKRGRPAATRIMTAPTPEMLAMLAGDVADNVAAAAGGTPPQAAPVPPMPPAFPPPMPVPQGGLGAPVVVLGGRGGALPPPMPIPRPQGVPQPVQQPPPEPPSQRGVAAAKRTQVGMGAIMNPAMRKRLEEQGKLPAEGEEVPGEGTATGAPDFEDTYAAPPGGPVPAQAPPGWPQAGAPAQQAPPGWQQQPPPGWPQPGPQGGPGAPAFVLGGAPPAPPAPAAEETKECPFCAERIKKQAIKCRFCNEYLVTTPSKANDPDAPPALDDKLYALPRDARGPAVAAPPPAPPRAPAPPPSPAPAPAPRPKDMQVQKTEMFQAPEEDPPAAPADEAPHWDLPPLDEKGS